MSSTPKARTFNFVDYVLEPEKKRAVFRYEITFSNRSTLSFSETILFPESFSLGRVPTELLKNALQGVHLMLGISYYKLYCPSKIIIKNNLISKKQADFWNTVYQKGLGEFFFRNGIDPNIRIRFPYDRNVTARSSAVRNRDRSLVGIGGGKDSIVVGELLKGHNDDFSALLIETQNESPIADAVVDLMGVPSVVVRRFLDPKIFESHEGSYNGHIPISAVFAFVGYLTAILYDYSHVVVGNERSSDFGNIQSGDVEINHQWSKSSEFERLLREYSERFLSPDIVYFSLLRPFHEIRIAEMFARYPKYFPVFSSCNRNVRIHKERPKTAWCGECSKCLFVFTMLSPFLGKETLVNIFGRNLFEEESLVPLFADILGFGHMKPFDCVGTFDEAQAALFLAREKYADSVVMRRFVGRIERPECLIGETFLTAAAPTLPARFAPYGRRNVLVLGYGKEGKMTERYLTKYFPEIEIARSDKSTDPEYLKKQDRFDLVIKTPGIPKASVTVPYTTATNIFFSKVRNTVIGVTGTKGKSTTASLIAAILKEAGLKVRLLGNIGTPMLGVLLDPINPEEIFVLELSSYQLDDVGYSPDVAVILNLFPEHMDYHGGVESYYDAKRNIMRFQGTGDTLVYDATDRRMRTWAKDSVARKVSYTDVRVPQGMITALQGEHNMRNIAAAVAAVGTFHISDDIVRTAIAKFVPLRHRLENLGEFRGITFYDDAISTTPESTMMALQTIPNVDTILLGGEDRGYDFSVLEKRIRKGGVRNVVLFPESGKRMFRSRDGLNVLETSSMEQAVSFAYAHTLKGHVCLLSTASPSYTLWKNFEEKGDSFRRSVETFSGDTDTVRNRSSL
ncbi:MAG: UDP-N-acetylmuramoyl-L-alanine--D-glutamate ligase [Candidatus Moranbacteria bacterium]|nr:UDP-N-acetylmuramoyl-L-alanine--D-glutamate ligase [Candidatus Moranbacteria bacterium]